MAKCENCGHNSAVHSDQTGKPDSCIECKKQGKICIGWNVKFEDLEPVEFEMACFICEKILPRGDRTGSSFTYGDTTYLLCKKHAKDVRDFIKKKAETK